MNMRQISRALAIAVFAGASCHHAPPPQPAPQPTSTAAVANTLTDAERAAGWRLLFDGSTGTGWRGYRQATLPAGWQVQNGALTRVGPGGDIITNDQFKNFELALEWKISPGGNSGIFYRASEDSDAIYWNAPEMQVLDDARHPDGQSRMTAAGAAYDLYPSPSGVVKPANEWNAVRIVVNGNHVEQWLNGVKVVAYEFGSPDFLAKVKDSKFAPHPNFGKNAEGHIGLQDHGDVVAFRSIKIRVLP
jgi:3-keto-disaccharide hydrolase